MNPVRVFSDRAYLPPHANHIWQLFPFWGTTSREANTVQPKRFAKYMGEAPAFLEMTSLEDCDFAIFPAEYQESESPEGRALFHRFTRLAASAGKATIVFTGGDLEHSLPQFGGYEFHTSLYRSTIGQNTFAMPPAMGDVLEEDLAGSLVLLAKEPRARLGFCGFAPPVSTPVGRRMLKEVVRDFLYSTGSLSRTAVGYAPRAKAIRALRSPNVIDTDIILRGNSRFEWSCGYLLTNGDARDIAPLRRHYLDNLLRSPYSLCVRGQGNYSLRFYEALCCGRIPVFVDTDCVLPLEDVINWKEYCVWVGEKDITHIEEILADFHAQISATRFQELQRACRELWVHYLSPLSFMRRSATDWGPVGNRAPSCCAD